MAKSKSVWECVDNRRLESDRTAADHYIVRSEDQLEQLIHSFSEGEPCLLACFPSPDEVLFVAIGGEFAGLEYFNRATLRSARAITNRPHTDKPRMFLGEGQPNIFQPSQLHSVESIIEMVKHFYTHSELPNWVEWR